LVVFREYAQKFEDVIADEFFYLMDEADSKDAFVRTICAYSCEMDGIDGVDWIPFDTKRRQNLIATCNSKLQFQTQLLQEWDQLQFFGVLKKYGINFEKHESRELEAVKEQLKLPQGAQEKVRDYRISKRLRNSLNSLKGPGGGEVIETI
jgi:hypothetical protein